MEIDIKSKGTRKKKTIKAKLLKIPSVGFRKESIITEKSKETPRGTQRNTDSSTKLTNLTNIEEPVHNGKVRHSSECLNLLISQQKILSSLGKKQKTPSVSIPRSSASNSEVQSTFKRIELNQPSCLLQSNKLLAKQKKMNPSSPKNMKTKSNAAGNTKTTSTDVKKEAEIRKNNEQMKSLEKQKNENSEIMNKNKEEEGLYAKVKNSKIIIREKGLLLKSNTEDRTEIFSPAEKEFIKALVEKEINQKYKPIMTTTLKRLKNRKKQKTPLRSHKSKLTICSKSPRYASLPYRSTQKQRSSHISPNRNTTLPTAHTTHTHSPTLKSLLSQDMLYHIKHTQNQLHYQTNPASSPNNPSHFKNNVSRKYARLPNYDRTTLRLSHHSSPLTPNAVSPTQSPPSTSPVFSKYSLLNSHQDSQCKTKLVQRAYRKTDAANFQRQREKAWQKQRNLDMVNDRGYQMQLNKPSRIQLLQQLYNSEVNNVNALYSKFVNLKSIPRSPSASPKRSSKNSNKRASQKINTTSFSNEKPCDEFCVQQQLETNKFAYQVNSSIQKDTLEKDKNIVNSNSEAEIEQIHGSIRQSQED